MMTEFKVENTDVNDLGQIFRFFEESIRYQEERGYPSWKNYDQSAIVKDIADRNQYKVVFNAEIAIVFSVCYSDKVIWRDLECGDSIYLHRIVVNPDVKGRRLFGVILEWAIKHCLYKKLRNIRMDTWAANSAIIEYYQSFGFIQVENFTTPDSQELPTHNRNLALTLLEYSKIK